MNGILLELIFSTLVQAADYPVLSELRSDEFLCYHVIAFKCVDPSLLMYPNTLRFRYSLNLRCTKGILPCVRARDIAEVYASSNLSIKHSALRDKFLNATQAASTTVPVLAYLQACLQSARLAARLHGE